MTLDAKNHRAFIVDVSMDVVYLVDLQTGDRKVIAK
jgi:hypothetical protein